MASTAARYDGHAEWYDGRYSTGRAEELAFVAEALGPGDGQVCLDLACGTGLCAQTLAEAGYRAVGFDISADQLRFGQLRFGQPRFGQPRFGQGQLGQGRPGAAVRADVCSLPVRDKSVPAVVGMFFHTDLADFAPVVRQVARCLRPGGRFIYAGLHPCFLGPFVNRTSEAAEQRLEVLPGYGRVGWANRGSGDGSGPGGRVGFHHKTLASFLGAFVSSGLRLREVREFSGGGVILPRNIGLVAER